jgi:hypothetical protein
MSTAIAAICDLSTRLQSLPAQPLHDLLARATGREFFKNAGPVDMLKVFISEHICDDVEDRFGSYSDRQIVTMSGKDFMLKLSFDQKAGIDPPEVCQFISSRLTHWNIQFEALILENARQFGILEIVRVLQSK